MADGIHDEAAQGETRAPADAPTKSSCSRAEKPERRQLEPERSASLPAKPPRTGGWMNGAGAGGVFDVGTDKGRPDNQLAATTRDSTMTKTRLADSNRLWGANAPEEPASCCVLAG
ncbi:hypothetical protein Q1695_015776 [Nippostrongylus brasiliensis]|nr:hypothetical protein Q1695_015776 [Nippostrongylus brasiliensis]